MSLRPLHLCAVVVLAALFQPGSVLGEPSDPAAYTLTKIDRKLLADDDAADQVLEQQGFIYHNAELEAHLAELASPMFPAVRPEGVVWKIRVLRDPVPNAMAFANGSIYIHTGLLSLLENDDQVAGVLGNEITHVVNRHEFKAYRERLNKAIAMELLHTGLMFVPGGGLVRFAALNAIANVSEFAAVAAIYGYGRDREREADQNAVVLMKRCGRNPAQLARLFQLLDERLEPAPIPIFFLDHPKLQERIADVKGLIGTDAAPADAGASIYYESYPGLIGHDIQLGINQRLFRTAIARAERLAKAHPGDSEDLFVLGEAYRALGPRTAKPTAQEQSDSGRRAAYRQKSNRTEEEEEKALAATRDGSAALIANQRAAENCYLKAAGDPGYAKPHLGLGTLYEQQGKTAAALSEYRKYVKLAPGTPEAHRIGLRIERLEKRPTPAS